MKERSVQYSYPFLDTEIIFTGLYSVYHRPNYMTGLEILRGW